MHKTRLAASILASLTTAHAARAQSVWQLPESITTPRGQSASLSGLPWLTANGSSVIGNFWDQGDFIGEDTRPGYHYVFRANESETVILEEQRNLREPFVDRTGELVAVSSDGSSAVLRYDANAVFDPDAEFGELPLESLIFRERRPTVPVGDTSGGIVNNAQVISRDGSALVSSSDFAVSVWRVDPFPDPREITTFPFGELTRVLDANSDASVFAGRSGRDGFVYTEQGGTFFIQSPDDGRDEVWTKHVSEDGSRLLVNIVEEESIDYFHRAPTLSIPDEWDPLESRAMMWPRTGGPEGGAGELVDIGFEGAEWSYFDAVSDNGAFATGVSDLPGGPGNVPQAQFLWTEQGGVVPLLVGPDTLGYAFGDNPPLVVTDISDDGRTLLYVGRDDEGLGAFFLARVPAPGTVALFVVIPLVTLRRHR